LGYSNRSSEKNLDRSHSYSKEDFMVCYSNIYNNTEDTWKLGLELYNDKHTIFSLGSSGDIHSQYQVYAITNETSEEYDANNNPIINPVDVRRGANHMAEGDTKETIAAKVKVQLTTAEWETIRAAVNNGATIPIDARREVFLGVPLRPASTSTTTGKGEKQNKEEAGISQRKKNAATRRIQTAPGTIGMVLG
jgi:hypothetical protein